MATYATREELYAVLDKVVAGLNESQDVKNRIKSANVSMGIVVSDLENAEFVIGFKDGAVTGAHAGAATASITITLKQDVLDKLFSGKLSGESAYFSGQLRLRGDEWVAQSAASYIYYMTPLYKAATGQ